MNAKEYQIIYQNIKNKSPIESGVQALVYMFLYDIINDTDYQLIVIDRMDKKTQFTTSTGISDLVIVNDEFSFFEENKDKIISYVEVKAIDTNLCDFEEQIKGQLLSCGKILYTNGNDWKYYDIKEYIEQHSENEIDHIKRINDYKEIKAINGSLELTERELALKKSSYAHTRNNEYKSIYKKDISELETKRDEIREELKKLLMDIHWLEYAMEPSIDMKLYDNDSFDAIKYLKLKSKLYDVISEW